MKIEKYCLRLNFDAPEITFFGALYLSFSTKKEDISLWDRVIQLKTES